MPLLPLLLTGTIVFVDASATGANDGSSWADAFTDLQSALAIPWHQVDQIWIAAGTYRPSQTGDRTASFRIGSREIYGGFDGTESALERRAGLFDRTILDGDLLGDDGPDFTHRQDNSLHVVIDEGASLIDGLTIRGGHADPKPGQIGGCGGLALGNGSEARDCLFVDNYAGDYGGGVFIDAVYQADLRRCTFLGNVAGTAGGGVWSSNMLDKVTFDRCRFLGNRSRAGGAFVGGGVFRGCVFSGNRARGGLGGGAILGYWVLDISNCTFFGNDATDTAEGGGAIHVQGLFSWPPMANSIFWQNADDEGEGFVSQIRLDPQTPYVRLRNSCVPEFHASGRGLGNLRTDPEFVLPLGVDGTAGTLDDDLRLRPGSPCIDRGDDGFLSDVAPVDLAGGDRTVDALACGDGGVVDIGAYESQLVQGTTNYCEAAPSSLGVPAIVSGPCARGLDAGDLALSAGPVPTGGGFFVFGPDRAETPLGNGLLCIGGALHRTPFVLPQGAWLSTSVDLSDPTIAGLLLPGTCWSFQAIYRDPAAGGAALNLSDAIRVTFH